MRIVLLILCCFIPLAGWAQNMPPSGLALPRFASLKFDKIYARAGPDQNYPINWVYTRQGMPVEITQEYNDWRKIRDIEGGEGWVHKIQLSGKRRVIVQSRDVVALTAKPDPHSLVMARVAPHVVAGLDKCDATVCRINGDGYKGWIPRNLLWGIYVAEDLH